MSYLLCEAEADLLENIARKLMQTGQIEEAGAIRKTIRNGALASARLQFEAVHPVMPGDEHIRCKKVFYLIRDEKEYFDSIEAARIARGWYMAHSVIRGTMSEFEKRDTNEPATFDDLCKQIAVRLADHWKLTIGSDGNVRSK